MLISFHSLHRRRHTSACRQYTLTHIKAEMFCLMLLACVFLHVTSSHLTARLALLLCIDVDGCLIDTCECVVPWIVSGGLKYIYIYLKKCLIGFWGISAQIIRYETTTYTEQYGLFLWLTKLLAVSTILQTSQWKHALCQFWQKKRPITLFYRVLKSELYILHSF